jgi:cytochrome c oxidase subunit 3
MFWFKPTEELRLATDLPGFRRLSRPAPTGVGTLGMTFFILSLTFVFGASLLLYVLLVRAQESPLLEVLPIVLPGALASTLILGVSSWTLVRATKAISADRRTAATQWLGYTLALGLLFVVVQSFNWFQMRAAGLSFDATNRHAAFFYLLTLLHALHVLGGIVRLAWVWKAARRGRYSAESHEAITNVAYYWHYLDVVWVLMLITIYAVST